MGAVDEGIEVAPVGRVEQFAAAVGAGGDVGQDERGCRACMLAGADFEARITNRVEPLRFETDDAPRRRQIGAEPDDELVQPRRLAFDFDDHPLRRVVHPAVQPEFRRQPIDKRPKTDALHRAAHGQTEAER